MMKYTLATLFFISIIMIGCTKEDTFNTYDMAFEETINHNKELNVKFSDIVDSRCPSAVICVWEGQAEVTFELDFKEEGNVENLTLISRVGFPALADTIFMDYRFQLIEVDPYPENDYPAKEEYTVRLLIEGI